MNAITIMVQFARYRTARLLRPAFPTLFAFCLLAANGAELKAGKGKRIDPAEDLFTKPTVFRIEIQIPDRALGVLRDSQGAAARGGGGPGDKRPAVKVTVTEGEKTYKDVALHLKGAAGSFRSIDDEPSLTLNFDKFVKGQTFHGVERISLNNSVQDRSLLNEKIAREMFAAAGVPVPRAAHAKVKLNGRDLGVYVLTEAFNKQFLARHFKNPDGNLYDGGFVKDVDDGLEKSSGPNPNDRSDLDRLVEAAKEPQDKRLAKLGQVLDLDRFITHMALDVMTCNWDGYAINKNNYRIYHDPDSDKLVFMPHGMDQMFGVMRVGTGLPLFPRMQGLVARAVLQVPEGRELYRQRISQLMTNVYNVEVLTNRIFQLTDQLRPSLTEQGPNGARFQQREAAHFARRVAERAVSVREQLSAPDRTLKFDTMGFARIGPWRPRADYGKPVLEELVQGGKAILHVNANGASCVGLWSTKVQLAPGRYRLEGKVKGTGIVADAGDDRKAGAGLRINGRRFAQKVTGSSDWTPIVFEFEIQDQQSGFGFFGPVEDAQPDVELICELRAAKGEAWFDRDSLRLSRR